MRLLSRSKIAASALTLLELTVVIAIILLLVLVSFPLIQRTGLVLRLRCQSNLRELGTMLSLYAHQNSGRLPDFSFSRWCGAIGAAPGGVYTWQTLPNGELVWFIDERDAPIFHCPARPLPKMNTQGIRSHYAGLAIHSARGLYLIDNGPKRILLFEYDQDPGQVLQSVGSQKQYVYAYDSFEPSSGPLRIATNHPPGGDVLFADMHVGWVEGRELDVSFWEESYSTGQIMEERP